MFLPPALHAVLIGMRTLSRLRPVIVRQCRVVLSSIAALISGALLVAFAVAKGRLAGPSIICSSSATPCSRSVVCAP